MQFIFSLGKVQPDPKGDNVLCLTFDQTFWDDAWYSGGWSLSQALLYTAAALGFGLLQQLRVLRKQLAKCATPHKHTTQIVKARGFMRPDA